jgi:hypothetical protein
MAARDARRPQGHTGGLGAIRRGAAVACQRGGVSGGVASVVVDLPLAVREMRLGAGAKVVGACRTLPPTVNRGPGRKEALMNPCKDSVLSQGLTTAMISGAEIQSP